MSIFIPMLSYIHSNMHLVKHTVRCASTRMDGIQLQETQLGEAHSGRMAETAWKLTPWLMMMMMMMMMMMNSIHMYLYICIYDMCSCIPENQHDNEKSSNFL